MKSRMFRQGLQDFQRTADAVDTIQPAAVSHGVDMGAGQDGFTSRFVGGKPNADVLQRISDGYAAAAVFCSFY